jgi:hypothetical protein
MWPVKYFMMTFSVLSSYLQFFFNLSLVLVFLYLVLQFILTVQRDVEQRISEYSMGMNRLFTFGSHESHLDIFVRHSSRNCHVRVAVQKQLMRIKSYTSNGSSMRQLGNMYEPRSHCCRSRQSRCRNDSGSGEWVCGTYKLENFGKSCNSCFLFFLFQDSLLSHVQAFTLTSLSFLTVFINSLLSLYRSRHHAITAPTPQHQPAYSIPPAPPFPPAPFGGYLSPAPTPRWVRPPWFGVDDEDEEPQSPTRRRRLEGGATAKIR